MSLGFDYENRIYVDGYQMALGTAKIFGWTKSRLFSFFAAEYVIAYSFLDSKTSSR